MPSTLAVAVANGAERCLVEAVNLVDRGSYRSVVVVGVPGRLGLWRFGLATAPIPVDVRDITDEALRSALTLARECAALIPPTVPVEHLACDGWRSKALLGRLRAGMCSAFIADADVLRGRNRRAVADALAYSGAKLVVHG